MGWKHKSLRTTVYLKHWKIFHILRFLGDLIRRRPDSFLFLCFDHMRVFVPPTVFTKSGRIWFRFVKTFTCNHWLLTVQYWVGNFKFWPISLLFGWAGKRWPDIRTHLQASRERKVSKVVQRSDCYAMLMSPNKGKTAVHGCRCPYDMAVRMREVRSALQYSACRIKYVYFSVLLIRSLYILRSPAYSFAVLCSPLYSGAVDHGFVHVL